MDARPSDALSLALAVDAPIRVERAVLDAAEAHRPCPPRSAWYEEGCEGASVITAQVLAS